jgi:eukaryotic-like serine/threonine-protein kinase
VDYPLARDDDEGMEAELGRMGEPTLDLGDGAPVERAAVGPVRRYVLLERLGEGGSGVVYTAYDLHVNRKVALKVLRREESLHARARFLREAQALARLNHPNVVAAFDAGTVGERPYLAMELIEGRTLAAWLAERPHGWREILAVYLQAGAGLRAATTPVWSTATSSRATRSSAATAGCASSIDASLASTRGARRRGIS